MPAQEDVKVMISGGFKAALKLAPEYERRTGDNIVIIPGPSMSTTPQAIPNRLARGESRRGDYGGQCTGEA